MFVAMCDFTNIVSNNCTENTSLIHIGFYDFDQKLMLFQQIKLMANV